MLLLEQILPGVGLAGAVTAGGLFLGTRFGQNRSLGWWSAVMLVCGYISGHVLTAGWPRFPPNEATAWLFYFAWGGLVWGVFWQCLARWAWAPLVFGLAWVAGLFRLLLASQFLGAWRPLEGWFWIFGLAVGTVLFAGSLRTFAARASRRFSLPLLATILAAGSGFVLLLSGSLLLGWLAWILCAATAALTVTGWAVPETTFERGVPEVLALLFGGLWLSGYFYAELPAYSAILLAAAPALGCSFPAAGSRETWTNFGWRMALAVLPIFGAVLLALRASPPLDY